MVLVRPLVGETPVLTDKCEVTTLVVIQGAVVVMLLVEGTTVLVARRPVVALVDTICPEELTVVVSD